MSEAQALIDDIAAEYPDLRDHEDEQPFHDGLPGDDVQGDGEGDEGQPGDMSGLTDEALRQFANAAAMHYELGRGEGETQGKEGQGDDEDAVEGLASGDATTYPGAPELGEPGQVVSGSIPPPPRPTYETTHPTHQRIDPNEMTTLQSPVIAGPAPSKRKRPSEEAFEQPLQAQGPPRGKKQHRLDAVDAGLIDPSITNSSDTSAAAAGALSPRDLAQYAPSSSSRIPPVLVIAPQPTQQPHAARGRKPSVRHDEMMAMGMTTDHAAEGSDTGRKENKDERFVPFLAQSVLL